VPGNVLRHFARDDVTEFEFTHRRQHAARGKAELSGLGLSMMFNDLAAGKPPEPAGQVVVMAMTLIAPMVELGPEIRVMACWVAPDPQGRLSYSVSAFKESIIPLLGDGGVALSEAILCGYRQGQTKHRRPRCRPSGRISTCCKTGRIRRPRHLPPCIHSIRGSSMVVWTGRNSSRSHRRLRGC
jgi:hypothetical protein